MPVDSKTPFQRTILSVTPAGVIVTAFKPSFDGKGLVVRLFNTSEQLEQATLSWAEPAPKTVWLSNLAEERISKINGPIEMSSYEIVTLRVPLTGK
jgi:alpha-mannosidase